MKTAILGGSFNPVHSGHIALAEDVIKLGYVRILFIPTSNPPHKTSAGGATDKDRIKMLYLALKDIKWAEVWDGEIRRGGFSYSIDTVRELKASGIIDSRPGLIIGDDLIEGFPSWKNVDDLVKETDIILARRDSGSSVDLPYNCRRLENTLWPYSSTEVRKHITEGTDLKGIVPSAVADYIELKGLYRDATT